MKKLIISKLILAFLLCPGLALAQTLKGSSASIDKQYRAALSYGYAFVSSGPAVKGYVNTRQLLRVSPDRYLELHDVSYPYAVPHTQQFLGRLSQQYYNACGEKLTVTSLLRPRDRQPANSVAHSVHPAGMAIDLRIPRSNRCRAWLENTLLSLEKQQAVDVTRERYPPHYHVAVFNRNPETRMASNSNSNSNSSARSSYSHNRGYVVRKGDTLSGIAASTGVAVAQLRTANGLRGSLINVGQKLQIPVTGAPANATMGQQVASSVITHRVNRGDTLWRIANRYGTSVKKLRESNSQADDYLQVGQVLRIYKG